MCNSPKLKLLSQIITSSLPPWVPLIPWRHGRGFCEGTSERQEQKTMFASKSLGVRLD